jgi:hypothetical protein
MVIGEVVMRQNQNFGEFNENMQLDEHYDQMGGVD